MLSASCSEFPAAYSNPVCWWITTSRREPRSLAITGLPHAYDSKIAFPRVSYASEGKIVKRDAFRARSRAGPCT
jgi:hypothetical protein